MSETNPQPAEPNRPAPARGPAAPAAPGKKDDDKSRPRLDPTRYGDWEKNGRCIDF